MAGDQSGGNTPLTSNNFKFNMGMFDGNVQFASANVPGAELRTHEQNYADEEMNKPAQQAGIRNYGGTFEVTAYATSKENSFDDLQDKTKKQAPGSKTDASIVIQNTAHERQKAWRFTDCRLENVSVDSISPDQDDAIKVTYTFSFAEMNRRPQ